ncbi:MAG: molybdenum cofactor biosynthesis protein MoaE [Oceanococcaceae bacterium]
MSEHLSANPLALSELFSAPRDDCGATVAFVGTVRNLHQGEAVDGLHYSAHEPSADAALARICDEARARFDIRELRILHRLGALGIGDAAVLLVCQAPHREAAFEAARWALETLKQQVPIFKQEHYVDGASTWLDGQSLVTSSSPDS